MKHKTVIEWRFPLRLSAEQRRWLALRAKANDMSINAVIRQLINAHMGAKP